MAIRLNPTFAQDKRFRSTLFRSVSATAEWNEDAQAYKLAYIFLVDFPVRKSDGSPDFRFSAATQSIPFSTFGERVRLAVEQVGKLDTLRAITGSAIAGVSTVLPGRLRATLDGIYLDEWPHAPVVGTGDHAKLAVEAVLELLQIEATLPTEQI